jgi:hypothetical protein
MALSVSECTSYISVTTSGMQRCLITHYHNYANTEVMYVTLKATDSRHKVALTHDATCQTTALRYKVFLSSWHRARPFYREETLHPAGHLARAAVPRTTTRADRIRDSNTGGTLTMISASVLNMPSEEYDTQTTCWMRRYKGRQQYFRTVLREQKQWNGNFVLAIELDQGRQREI